MSIEFEQKLEKFLENVKKLLILGIGNELKGDDAFGIVLAEKLKRSFENIFSNEFFKVIVCGITPENYTKEIIKFAPSHIILFDVANFSQVAGEINILDEDEIGWQVLSTHTLPLNYFIDYIQSNIASKIISVVVQPKTMLTNADISEEIKISIDLIYNCLSKYLNLIKK